MDMQLLERVKQQWEFAADAMPQFICLLDCEGHVIRANRTVERWNPGIEIQDVGGQHLHDLLHSGCDSSICYLRRFWDGAAPVLARGRQVDCDAWDPILARHFRIHAHRPSLLQQQSDSLSQVYAVIAVDDVTEFKASEKASEDRALALARKVGSGPGITSLTDAEELLRETQTELRRIAAQHLTIQETERRRIAADLHDGLGQSLSLIKLGMQESLRKMHAGTPQDAASSVKQLVSRVEDALIELHRIAMDLRPSTLDDLGILPTLSWFVREFESANLTTRIEKHISVSEADVPEPLKIAIFRILQEAVNNAVKYSGADCIKVNLHNGGDVLTFTIEDDGKGFDADALAGKVGARRGLGLQSMKERAELSGGACEVTSAAGQGTKVCVWWPAGKARDGYRDQPDCSLCGRQSGLAVDGIGVRACYCSDAPGGGARENAA